MDNSNKEELLLTITSILDFDHRNRSDFIVDDCTEFINSIHVYRLQHLIDNSAQFVRYIDNLQRDYEEMLKDNTLSSQAQTTTQALFLLSCAEFASGSKERMLIKEKEMEEEQQKNNVF